MTQFTAIIDESGSPNLPPRPGQEYFSVGILIPEKLEEMRKRIECARRECPDERVQRRGFFHAREDSREGRRFLAKQLKGIGFHFKMLSVDKRAALQSHQVKSPRSLHRILFREALKYGISAHCREVDLLVGEQRETLKSRAIVQRILEYHDFWQILEAVEFPYGSTVRTKVNHIVMITGGDEPLLDVVDYLIWASACRVT